jgi:hypothetical protein
MVGRGGCEINKKQVGSALVSAFPPIMAKAISLFSSFSSDKPGLTRQDTSLTRKGFEETKV